MSDPEFPKSRSPLRRSLVLPLRMLAAGMPLACAVLLIPWDGWLFELLRHFRLWNAVIGLATAVLLLLLRDWRFGILALLAGIWQGWPVAASRIDAPENKAAAATGSSLILMTFNLNLECREPERMIDVIRASNPDVLLLLEYTPAWQMALTAGLWSGYPHRLEEPRKGFSGICLASRLPLDQARILEDEQGIPAVRAGILGGPSRVEFLGVHPPPPLRPEMQAGWLRAFKEWPAMIGGRGPRVMAGDFNCTPFARAFTALCERSGLRDSAQGFGLSNTWYVGDTILGLPIDHVLVSPDLIVQERKVGPPTTSDHRYVMVRLQWRR